MKIILEGNEALEYINWKSALLKNVVPVKAEVTEPLGESSGPKKTLAKESSELQDAIEKKGKPSFPTMSKVLDPIPGLEEVPGEDETPPSGSKRKYFKWTPTILRCIATAIAHSNKSKKSLDRCYGMLPEGQLTLPSFKSRLKKIGIDCDKENTLFWSDEALFTSTMMKVSNGSNS